ncbi:MAG: FAD-dependent oxidoreductase [Pseudomonadota bacterium]
MHHIVIGAGPAGVIAAETIRKHDPGCRITLVGDEPEEPYSRMALPYFLSGHIGEKGTHLRKTKQHYQDSAIECVKDRVVRVDPGRHGVKLERAGELSYDKLLIATGSHPATPPIPGIDSPGIYSCWTLADARNIASRLSPGAKVVLLGAGFIGCIILEALAKQGADLTVVEMEDRMVPRMMNDQAGGLIKQWCQGKGVSVLTSTRVTSVEEGSGESPLAVRLDSGAILPADLMVSATGVRSNISFLEGSGIGTDQGVLVNRYLQSSDPDIYAAGDVAQGLDFSTGAYSVQAIQPTAADHGQLAGRNMAGARVAHRGSINMNVLDTMGLISSSFGLWMGVDCGESTECCDPGRYHYINLQFEDDTLVGATSIGLTQHVGVLRGLIQSRIRLGKWKNKLLKNPSRIMEAYLSSTQAIGFNASLL